MDNYIFEQEYPFVSDDFPDDESMQFIAKTVQGYHKYLVQIPRVINPIFEAHFRKVLLKCNRLAKIFSGKIKAEINYKTFEANIEVRASFLEFERGELLDLLQELSLYSNNVLFQPLTNGDLQLQILMPYFSYLTKPESMVQFLEKHPDENMLGDISD